MEKGKSFAHSSWQVKADFLLGFCLGTDVAGSSSRKIITEIAPRVLRGVGRTVSVTETKAIFVCFERAIADIQDKKCKTTLWLEPQTVWHVSKIGSEPFGCKRSPKWKVNLLCGISTEVAPAELWGSTGFGGWLGLLLVQQLAVCCLVYGNGSQQPLVHSSTEYLNTEGKFNFPI